MKLIVVPSRKRSLSYSNVLFRTKRRKKRNRTKSKVEKMKLERIKLGLLGVGNHAQKVHIPVIEQHDLCELHAVASTSPYKLSQIQESHSKVQQFNDYESILASPDIEAVIISTSNHLHGQLVIEALKNNKHVLCEKPLSWNNNEITEIESLLEQKNDLILCCGFMYRQHPLYEFVKESIQGHNSAEELPSGPHGEISGEISNEIIARFHYPPITTKNIRNIKELGGGALLDIGCYLLDVAEFIFPRGVDSSLDLTSKNTLYSYDIDSVTGCDVSGFLSFRNNNNTFHASFSQNMPRNQNLQIWTPHTGLTCDSPFLIPRNKSITLTIHDKNGKKKQKTFEPFNVFYKQLSLFCESITQKKLIPPLTDGLNNSKILSLLHQEF